MGIMVLGKGGRITHVNKKMAECIPHGSGDLVGSYLYDLVKPSNIPGVLERIKGPEEGKEGLKVELRENIFGNKQGMMFYGPDGMGSENGFVILLDDISISSDLKSIDLDILEELSIPMDILKKNMEVYFQNSASEEMVTLLSKGKDPITKPTKQRKVMLMDCFTKLKGGEAEVRLRSKAGPLDFNVIGIPLSTSTDDGLTLEIWVQRTGQDEGGKRAILLRGLGDELIESSNAIIIGLDLEGNITLFNKGARRTLGYGLEEVMGRPWFDLLLERDAEKGRLEVLKWDIGTGFRTQYKSKVRSSSGIALTISLENTAIFDEEGNVSLILMVGQDITKIKELEESLRDQTTKLLDAIEEADIYTDLMIHDIYNANTGIMGYLELMNLDPQSEKKRKEYISRALTEIRKSSRIIRDVKLMSKAGAQVQTAPIDLKKEILEAVNRVREEYQEREMKIDIDAKNYHVLTDELLHEALFRVIENLLHRSGSRDKVRINVKANRDPPRSTLLAEPVHLVIEDNGDGMKKENLENVFRRPTSTDTGSHGLGFYLIKRMIIRYGGIIWIENREKKKGLSVHILLKEAV